MKVTYFGQASTLIEGGGKKLLVDPWLTEGAYHGTWFHTHLLADAGVTLDTFPFSGVDALFLSHEHEDHVDAHTLRRFRPEIPVYICRFGTPRFRRYLESLGLRNIHEIASGHEHALSPDLKLTPYGSAEYTDDAAVLVEAEGVRVFNETDCKLNFEDLKAIGERGVDLGFYMFSGANWFPMLYGYPAEQMNPLVERRRASLLKSLVARVKLTKPRFAVPSAGPCTILEPEYAFLNEPEHGIFIDPLLGAAALERASLPARPTVMTATDAWTPERGLEIRSPALFREPRTAYLADAIARTAPEIARWRAAETPAGADLPQRLAQYFEARVGALSEAVRKRIQIKLALDVTGPHGGAFTVDFTRERGPYVSEGIVSDWNYRIQVEDKLLYPYLTGAAEFLEHLFLSLRLKLGRRPDEFSEPLYNFLYDPNPERLERWYASR